MSSEIAIKVESLSKCYQIYEQPRDRLKQFVLPRIQHRVGLPPKQYYHEFWALNNVSFDVRKGETVGIIGRNGSGKSTLLQIICGTLSLTTGSIATSGRIAALLELGSGFNPEFTGRENVYMNASVLGLSKEEIDARFDEIAAFADIGEFIEQPVKIYSSGMGVRLAFAVQAQVEPNILIVDEALAVGDARFQAKCFKRLSELRERGTSILLVTHSTEQVVTHCDRAILLEGGRLADEGAPRSVVNHYLDLLYGQPAYDAKGPYAHGVPEEQETDRSTVLDERLRKEDPDFACRAESLFETRPAYNPNEYRWGDKRAEIMDFFIFASELPFPPAIESGSRFIAYVRCRFIEEVVRPIFGFILKTKEGVTIYGMNTETGTVSGSLPQGAAGQSFVIRLEFDLPCAAGDYFLSIGLASRNVNGEVIPHDRRYDAIHLRVSPGHDFVGLVNFSANLEVK